MLLGKVVVALLLLACAIGYSYPATALQTSYCTSGDANGILIDCHEYIKNGPVNKTPDPRGPCCHSVRVLHYDMQCIVTILTNKQKSEIDIMKILALRSKCRVRKICVLLTLEIDCFSLLLTYLFIILPDDRTEEHRKWLWSSLLARGWIMM
jgi:hypothetical protein